MLDVFLDALLDTLKTAPFLFAAYLLIEYLEHRSEKKLSGALGSGKYGVLGGAVLGCIPQCGISAAAAHLFAGGVIGAGTLIAVFISTSDEAIPVILSNPDKLSAILPLLLMKVLLAVIFGLLFDALFRRKGETHPHRHHGEDCDECRHTSEAAHGHDCGGGCEHNVFLSAVKHTVTVLFWIFLLTFAVGVIIFYVGEDRLKDVLSAGRAFQPIAAALIGMIPNCAASVVLTELYLSGALSFGAVVAGLSAGAGFGLIALFRANKNLKENLLITAFLLVTSIFTGSVLQLIF